MKIDPRNIRAVKNELKRNYIISLIPFIGLFIGWKLDKMEDERLSRFRDKSALYGRNPPPETPTW